MADVIAEEKVPVEGKAAGAIDEIHRAQLLSDLEATRLRVGLILDFGTARLGIRRMWL